MRTSGILLHISSLPSPYGIGTYGKSAYDFVDLLDETNQTYWQILPLGPTSYGDSPYQTFSAFANNPYFIDLDILIKEKLLKKNEITDVVYDPMYVDYEQLYIKRYDALKQAFNRFDQSDSDYQKFLKAQAFWLNDYALFMAIKATYDGKSWLYWDEDVRLRKPNTIKKLQMELKDEIAFHQFLQFKADQQWHALKNYANQKGIKIIGDMPIYVSYDSSDVWANPKMFDLDEKNVPYHVAGVPPDNYAKDGQLWGNPLYHWGHLKDTNYQWWVDRVRASVAQFDMIRIDHFIGFVNYFSIPFADKTAKNGVWKKGPGYELFEVIKKELGEVNIIAEDLGAVTPEVVKVLDATGYPGMKLTQFGFNSIEDNNYLPHHYKQNVIAYTGTHDNFTTAAWFDELSPKALKNCLAYINCEDETKKVDALIKETLKCVADTVIIPMQDYLNLGNEARMNIPSTLGNNWVWRLKDGQITKVIKNNIKTWTELYARSKKDK